MVKVPDQRPVHSVKVLEYLYLKQDLLDLQVDLDHEGHLVSEETPVCLVIRERKGKQDQKDPKDQREKMAALGLTEQEVHPVLLVAPVKEVLLVSKEYLEDLELPDTKVNRVT